MGPLPSGLPTGEGPGRRTVYLPLIDEAHGGIGRMKVKEIMSSPVVCAPADTPIAELATLLARHAISAVPVAEEGEGVIGLVNE